MFYFGDVPHMIRQKEADKVLEVQLKNPFHSAAAHICPRIRPALLCLPDSLTANAQEIRLRHGGPVHVCCHDRIYELTGTGAAEQGTTLQPIIATRQDMSDTLALMCAFSVYSHQNEINQGFLSLRGGHRAGLCGTAVLTDGVITGIRDISSINLRVGRQLTGCAEGLMKRILPQLDRGFLLAGPPSSGKTTLLRDIIRLLSLSGRRVAVVDERGEIGAVYQGERHNDLGQNCDLLTGYPKTQGLLHAIRGLSPEFLVCDELSGTQDTEAVEQALNAGVALIATVHAGDRRDLVHKRHIRTLLETGAFASVILLSDRRTPGQIQEIYEAGELLAADHRRDLYGDCRDGDRLHSFQPSRQTG